MNESNGRQIPVWVWIIGGGALLLVCLCTLVAVVAAPAFIIFQRAGSESPTVEVIFEEVEVMTVTAPAVPDDTIEITATLPAVETPEVAATVTATVQPGGTGEEGEGTGRGDTPENAALRAQIEANVSEIRGLEPETPVVTTLLSSEELRERVEEDLFAELTEEEAREFTLVLHAFDFVPRDFDYYNFTLDLYSEQIAGFYDPETDEFVIVSDDDELDVMEQWTHAHEFMHALQDQYFSLDLLDDEELDSEASAALLALIEGEATLVQSLYLFEGYFTFEEINEIFALSTETESPVLDSAPPVLANNLLFPYTAGLEFAQALYQQGGFAALDEAWANLPRSTEHILHPDRYLAGDMPQIVALAPLTDTLGAGWEQLDEDIFGEFFLREYLRQELSESEVNRAATGWGGDRYAVYYNEAEDALLSVMRSAWDTPADLAEFAAALEAYNDAKYGAAGRAESNGALCWEGEDVTCVFNDGTYVLFITAPTLDLINIVQAALE